MKYRLSKKEKIEPIAPVCRKEAYFTFEDAQAMIKQIEETRVTRKIRAYQCNICGLWHLTSSQGKQ